MNNIDKSVPLKFWFNTSPRLALPFLKIKYPNKKICINLSELKKYNEIDDLCLLFSQLILQN